MDVSVSYVWITECIIFSSRSTKSPYMPSSLISISSLSVYASDSLTDASSLCTSPVVAREISEVSE
ncbi:hypothetical protein H5410_045973 [Solanum commersonii]|uniref:Uncharacterized protein n=1 Tax=Solanum commersonii TaxID=4109 RepID=A0A9J5XB05_SOLCO|nr:hypothetical protein H5410_045973 [Solanum commersonii]